MLNRDYYVDGQGPHGTNVLMLKPSDDYFNFVANVQNSYVFVGRIKSFAIHLYLLFSVVFSYFSLGCERA